MARVIAWFGLVIVLFFVQIAPIAAQGWDSGWYAPDPYAHSHDRGWQSAGTQVRCESFDHRTQYCRVDTRGGVALVNQLSRADCWEGSTWGWDRGGIWVSGGCRADFRLLGFGHAGWNHGDDWRWRQDWRDDDYRWRNDWRGRDDWRNARRVVCESRRGRFKECRIPHGRRVDIVRQLSRDHCELGVSWGWQRGVIWVDRGCRAEFAVF